MALSQKHRSSLNLSLSPVVGTEEAEALLDEFPANDRDLPASKDFVRAEIGALRSEMHSLFRRQTIWFCGAMLTAMSVSTAVNTWVVLSTR